ncbi:MAG: hypothetical protein M1372_02880 [Patescibacteria group bacterium]|nr:hypothetical protein [Patescibacteria group bacterium]
MKKIILPIAFFIATPLVLTLSLLYLSYFSYAKNIKNNTFMSVTKTVAFAAIPTTESLLEDQIFTQDKRVENLRLFFNRHGSPLEPFAQQMVNTSQKYGLDFSLLPAIAMQESNLCKKAPKDSYNCWGFGIYGKKVTKFSGFGEAIDTVAKTLATTYKKDGLISPEEIMSRYTPSNNGAWASSVRQFMNQLQ